MYHILVVDDDENFLKSMKKILSARSYAVETLANPTVLEKRLEKNSYQCILMDVSMPGRNGLELLETVQQRNIDTPVIFISGQSNIAIAVEALKRGAYDFIEKPPDPERMLAIIQNAVQKQELQEANKHMVQALESNYRLVAKSPQMRELMHQIRTVSATDATVLILGETGTGKELVAGALHYNGPRHTKPFIRINCAAIPSDLLESELFGYRKGSFTGAVADKRGKFVEADGGTLFLDEIGDMPLRLQAKLLRILENREVDVLGENFSRQLDVRVIAASNQNLQKLTDEGRFRLDLYHRLNVIRLEIPPLRERKEDIVPLACFFLAQFNDRYNKQILSFSRQAESILKSYDWKGNVRELRNIVEKLVIFTEEKQIGIREIMQIVGMNGAVAKLKNKEELSLREAQSDFEREFILQTLNRFNWHINETANALGIHRTNLFKKMRFYNLKRK